VTQLYESGVQKVTGAAAGPIATLLTPSTSRPDIREIGVFVSSAPATGPTIGIGRPAAIGVGAGTGALGQATDVGDPAGTCTLVTSFATTQPTAPTVPMRRMSLPNVIGAGIVWTWSQNELNVPISSNLVIWQFTALAVTYDVYVRWEE
jgi:hypothetical protein